MADDGVKISALNEILTAPVTGEYAAIAKAGASYKRDLGLLPSVTQKAALAGYGGTPSGTNPYTTQTGATALATALATPLSDLSRVMRINGDGVPTFPDNVAGRVYWNDDFTTTDSWSGINGTVSVSGGVLIGTATGTPFGISRAVSGSANNVIRIKVKASISVLLQIQLKISGVDTLVKTQQLSANQYSIVDFIAPSNFTSIIMFYSGASTGNTLSIDTIYIGSGLYDTPVYGKDGQVVAVNHGVVPVNGKRGKALLFQGKGAMPLVFNGPVIGPTGTIRFKFKTFDTLINGFYFGNTAWPAGLALFQNDGGATDLKGFSIGGLATNTEYTFSFYFSLTKLYVYRNGSLLFTYTLTTPLAISPNNLYIGTNTESSDGQNFTLYDFEYVAEAETLDAHIRFMNGDDAVDSQQKAITNVPNAIKVCDSKGNVRQPGLPVYADNTAALAGGLVAGEPYRTSTGVLMVVY